MTKYNGRKEV